MKVLMHAFISSGLDYFNVLLTRTRVQERITPVLQLLHWLPMLFQIDFKVLLLVLNVLMVEGLLTYLTYSYPVNSQGP